MQVKLARSSCSQKSHLQMPVVGSRALSCPKREALGTGELGKECPFGGNLKDGRIFRAACEAGPGL